MDDQILSLIRDQLATMNRNLERIHEDLEAHIHKDDSYWQQLDEQRGQLSTVKWLIGPGVAGFFGWLYNTLIKS